MALRYDNMLVQVQDDGWKHATPEIPAGQALILRTLIAYNDNSASGTLEIAIDRGAGLVPEPSRLHKQFEVTVESGHSFVFGQQGEVIVLKDQQRLALRLSSSLSGEPFDVTVCFAVE